MEENGVGEPPEAGNVSREGELDGEVPDDKVDGGIDQGVWNFHKQLREQQGGPVEGAGLGFSNLEQLAGLDCSGLDLVDQGGSDDCSHEVGKHGVLHSDGCVFDFPKGETVHEAAEHHKQQLGQEVVDIAVELGPSAAENEAELSVVGGSELGGG